MAPQTSGLAITRRINSTTCRDRRRLSTQGEGAMKCDDGGDFHGDYKLFDINSSYPNVMAKYKHPIGDFFDYKIKSGGPITDQTCFLKIECDNHGALVGRDENGLTPNLPHGIFNTTIHEFNMAIKHNLISNIAHSLILANVSPRGSM
jgi:hypothetical protein